MGRAAGASRGGGPVTAAGAAEIGPAVWRVLALLMGAGAVLAALLSWREHRAVRGRTRRLAGGVRERAPVVRWLRRSPWPPLRVGRRLREAGAALGAAALAGTLLDGHGRWAAGVVAASAAWLWQRRRAVRTLAEAVRRAEARSVERRLPLVAELMAACLAAGSEAVAAAEAVGRSTGGPLGDRLVRAASEIRLGAEPVAVWGRFGELPACEGLARCMERAGTAGVPSVQAVARLAAECRARRARAATTRARRVAVQVTAPLGLCFLPAFLAVGVAPVVLGLARSLV